MAGRGCGSRVLFIFLRRFECRVWGRRHRKQGRVFPVSTLPFHLPVLYVQHCLGVACGGVGVAGFQLKSRRAQTLQRTKEGMHIYHGVRSVYVPRGASEGITREKIPRRYCKTPPSAIDQPVSCELYVLVGAVAAVAVRASGKRTT